MATLKIKDNNGNWQLVGAPSDEVRYTTQVLTDEQKAQARDNIDAQNKIVGVAGQFVSFDENGNVIAQTIDRTSVIETNQGLEQKFWRGTKAEYDVIETKDEATMYIITDDNEDSSDNNSIPSMTRITLSPTSWDATALTQSVTVAGISADETAQIIQCSPYGASMSAAVENGIYCSGQAADTLTFTCTSVPTEKVQFVVNWQDCVWIEPPAELINFTIKYITDETIEYQAEEGMTWKEWIYSDYNTFGVTTEGSTEDGYYTDEYDGVYGVVGGLEVYVACDEIEYMDANTVITSGTKYYNMVGY